MAVESTFNLHETVSTVVNAMYAVICNILFQAGVYGLAVAGFFTILGFILFKRNIPVGRPFMNASRRLSIVCGLVAIPGILSLIFAHGLPIAGVANIMPIGFIIWWTLICVHMSAEEMNHRWF